MSRWERVRQPLLLALRLAVGGYLLLRAALGKWNAHWLSGEGVAAAVRHGLSTTPYAWYRPLLAVAATHAPAVAWLIGVSETAVGICLVTDIAIRPAALLQLTANVGYALMKGWSSASAGVDRIFVLALFLLAVYGGGPALKSWLPRARRPTAAAPPAG